MSEMTWLWGDFASSRFLRSTPSPQLRVNGCDELPFDLGFLVADDRRLQDLDLHEQRVVVWRGLLGLRRQGRLTRALFLRRAMMAAVRSAPPLRHPALCETHHRPSRASRGPRAPSWFLVLGHTSGRLGPAGAVHPAGPIGRAVALPARPRRKLGPTQHCLARGRRHHVWLESGLGARNEAAQAAPQDGSPENCENVFGPEQSSYPVLPWGPWALGLEAVLANILSQGGAGGRGGGGGGIPQDWSTPRRFPAPPAPLDRAAALPADAGAGPLPRLRAKRLSRRSSSSRREAPGRPSAARRAAKALRQKEEEEEGVTTQVCAAHQVRGRAW